MKDSFTLIVSEILKPDYMVSLFTEKHLEDMYGHFNSLRTKFCLLYSYVMMPG